MNNQQIFNVISKKCRHLATQEDRNGETVISFCMLPTNTDECEGNCKLELCPLLKGIKKEEFKASDLQEGKIYESTGNGTCKYLGIDRCMGESTYMFESLTYGGKKYCNLDSIGTYLKPL